MYRPRCVDRTHDPPLSRPGMSKSGKRHQKRNRRSSRDAHRLARMKKTAEARKHLLRVNFNVPVTKVIYRGNDLVFLPSLPFSALIMIMFDT